jgi:hypothetical protein
MTLGVIYTTVYRSKALVKLFGLMCKTFKSDKLLGSESIMTFGDILNGYVGICMFEFAPKLFLILAH